MSGVPSRPGRPPVGDLDVSRAHAVLAMPRDRSEAPGRTTGAPLIGTPDGRSVAVVACDRALSRGEGLEQVMEDLYELGLLEDPLSFERHHFGKAPREGTG